MNAVHPTQTSTSRASGWIRFAAVILLLNGLFSAIQGLVAVIGPNTYFAVVEGDLLLFNVAGWGWFNLLLGALLLATAFGLFGDMGWARTAAIVLVVISSVLQLLLVPVQPWWSIIVITINIVIIYALVARGDEMADRRQL